MYILVSLSIIQNPPMKSSFRLALSSSLNSFVPKYRAFGRSRPLRLTLSKEAWILLTNSGDLYGIIMIILSNIASFSFQSVIVSWSANRDFSPSALAAASAKSVASGVGVAFGLFSFDKNNFYNFLSAVIAFLIFVLLMMAIKSSGLKRYSLLIIIGGALGNLHDRLFFSAVPDFIDFHIGDFHWFIFNVSDIFITIGVIGMIILELTTNKKKFNEKN